MLPIVRDAAPLTVLDGCSNGELPDDVLVDVVGGQRLVRDAAASWGDMARAAARDGVLLIIDNAYRPLARQRELWDARYVTYDTGSGEKHRFEDRWWWRRLDAITAAVPGTSNHGWGRAIDLMRTDAQVGWLTEHAATYGWAAELESEPWHWHYIGGDYTPAPDPAPVPALTPEDPDMLRLRVTDDPAGAILMFTGDTVAWIANGTADAMLQRAGVKTIDVTVAEIDGLLKSIPHVGPNPAGAGSRVSWP